MRVIVRYELYKGFLWQHRYPVYTYFTEPSFPAAQQSDCHPSTSRPPRSRGDEMAMLVFGELRVWSFRLQFPAPQQRHLSSLLVARPTNRYVARGVRKGQGKRTRSATMRGFFSGKREPTHVTSTICIYWHALVTIPFRVFPAQHTRDRLQLRLCHALLI